MRRTLVVMMLLGLLAGALADPAAAKKKKKKTPGPRSMSMSYDLPTAGIGGVGGVCTSGGCPSFGVLPHESFARFEITDASGQPVFGQVAQDTNGDGSNERIAAFCGTTEEPIQFTPGFAVVVFVYPAGAAPACPGPGSSGTIEGIFSAEP